jgi:hypothetical protein
MRVKPKKRLITEELAVLPVPQAINQMWPMDFIHDQLAGSPSYRLFNVIDDYKREGLGIKVDLSLLAMRVSRELDHSVAWSVFCKMVVPFFSIFYAALRAACTDLSGFKFISLISCRFLTW